MGFLWAKAVSSSFRASKVVLPSCPSGTRRKDHPGSPEWKNLQPWPTKNPYLKGEGSGVRGFFFSPRPRFGGEGSGVRGFSFSPRPRFGGEGSGLRGFFFSPRPRFGGEGSGLRGFFFSPRPRFGGEGSGLRGFFFSPRPRFGGEGSGVRGFSFSPRPRFGGEGSGVRGCFVASHTAPSPPPPLPRSGGEGRKKSTGGTITQSRAFRRQPTSLVELPVRFLAPRRRRRPQAAKFPPALAVGRQPNGPENALDAIPADRLVAIDALKLTDQDRVVEAHLQAPGTQRRRDLADEQAHFHAQGRRAPLCQSGPGTAPANPDKRD